MKKLVVFTIAFAGFFVGMIDGMQESDTIQRGTKRKLEFCDISIEEFLRMNNFIADAVKRRPDLVEGFDLLQRNSDYKIYGHEVPIFEEFLGIKIENSGKFCKKDIVDAEKTIAYFLVPALMNKIDDSIKSCNDIDRIQDVESVYVMQHRNGFLKKSLKKALDSKKDIFYVKRFENNYLHVAAESNLPNLAQLCFDVDVDSTAKNYFGRTPYDCVVSLRMTQMKAMFLENIWKRDPNFSAKMETLRKMR